MEPLSLDGLFALPRWVAWRNERLGDRLTKVPYAPNGGGKARSDGPATWGSKQEAETRKRQLEMPDGGGIGIMLGDLGNDLVLGGLDLDSCRQPDGTLSDWAEEALLRLETYAEISPSGTGVKAFFIYRLSDLPVIRGWMGSVWGKMFKQPSGTGHPPAIELHLGNRYFAFTEAHQGGTLADLAHMPADVLRWIIDEARPAMSGRGSRPAVSSPERGTSRDHSRSAAAFRLVHRLVREGVDFEAVCTALRGDPTTLDWMIDKGEANGLREVRRIFDKAASAGPLIRLIPGEQHTAATEGENAIKTAELDIYQRGNTLVRPIKIDVPASHGIMTVAAGLHVIDVHGLIDALSGCARWVKFDARTDAWVPANPPRAVAEIILSRVGCWTVPRIAGVITTPTLRPDGSILSEPGYDPATRLFLVADPTMQLSAAVKNPTRKTALKALAILQELLSEFPFVSEVSRSVALSALITPVVRGGMPVAPIHVFRASTAGTGKSYLVDVASTIATGRPCPVAAAGAEESETEKRLTGLLLAGFPVASLDNVNGELGGDLLCQAIERPLLRIRRLGGSDIQEIENTTTLFATGNGLRVRGDMVRRTLVCDLDAEMERPELRPFTGNPVAKVIADRGRFVSACLIIVRAYILAGRPNLLPKLASFGDWSDLVRSALIWLELTDPAKSMEQAREDDPELADLREFISLWQTELPKGESFTAKALADFADAVASPVLGGLSQKGCPGWRDYLLRLFGERGTINTRRMGRWLNGRKGRITNGWRISIGGQAQGGVCRWQIEKVKRAGGYGG